MQTIENKPKVQYIHYQPPFSTLCSIGKSPFYGEIEVKYQPGNNLLEFMSFEEWLQSLATQEMTIEDLCRLTFDKLREALGDIPLSVSVHARTTVHAPVSATIKSKEWKNDY